MFLRACLAMVSLTCYFLMCEFDHNTGLITFNLSVCFYLAFGFDCWVVFLTL